MNVRSLARLTAVAALALTVLLTGCGSDDEAATDTATATTAAATDAADSDTSATEVQYDDWCDASLGVSTYFNQEPDVDFETASEAEISAAVKEYAAGGLRYIDPARSLIPDEIAEPINLQIDAIEEAAKTGDPSGFDAPELEAADAEAHAYDLANCDWAAVPVVAKDYSFAGIPPTVAAGVTSFDVTNEGKEFHQVIVVRKKDGVTESFDELMQLDEEEASTKVDTIFETSAAPGAAGYAVADLEPGEYLAVCFIPEGSVDPNAEPAPDAKPHAALGMHTQFTVG